MSICLPLLMRVQDGKRMWELTRIWQPRGHPPSLFGGAQNLINFFQGIPPVNSSFIKTAGHSSPFWLNSYVSQLNTITITVHSQGYIFAHNYIEYNGVQQYWLVNHEQYNWSPLDNNEPLYCIIWRISWKWVYTAQVVITFYEIISTMKFIQVDSISQRKEMLKHVRCKGVVSQNFVKRKLLLWWTGQTLKLPQHLSIADSQLTVILKAQHYSPIHITHFIFYKYCKSRKFTNVFFHSKDKTCKEVTSM